MAARAVILNLNCYYYWFDVNKLPFCILANMAARALRLKVGYYFEALL
jgi:hypothetical protein